MEKIRRTIDGKGSELFFDTASDASKNKESPEKTYETLLDHQESLLYEIFQRLQVTPYMFAKSVGIPRSTLSEVMTKKQPVAVAMIKKIEDAAILNNDEILKLYNVARELSFERKRRKIR